jgi:hypothetical protein
MRWFVALAVALTVVPVASARVPNACTLLTRPQAEAALGVKLQWTQPQGTKLYSSCTFHGRPYAASSPSAPTLTLIVSESTPARFLGSRDASRSAVTVHGIGEFAYTTGGVIRTLNVLGKGYAFTLMLPPDKMLPWAKTVAGQVLARL